MTVGWRGEDANGNNAASTSVTIPPGAAAGDVALIAHPYSPTVVGGTDPTLPTGWTQLDTQDWSASFRGRLYGKVLGAGEGGTTVSFNNGTQKLSAALGVISGAKAIHVNGVRLETTQGLTHVAATATATKSVVQVAFIIERESAPSTAFTAPSGFTLADEFHHIGSGATSAGVAYNLTPVLGGSIGGGSWGADGNAGAGNDAEIMWIVGVEFDTDVPVTDSGAGTDSSVLQRQSTVTDSGTATDSATVVAQTAKAVSDSAAGTDTAAISIGYARTDSGTAVDSASVVKSAGVPVLATAPDRSPFLIQIYTNTYPYQKVGEVGSYTANEFIIRHNAVGSWKIQLSPSDQAVLELARSDRRITVDYRGVRVMSGEVFGVRRAKDERKITNEVYGFDDLRWLERRIGYPNPAASFPADGTSFTQGVLQDAITDNAESIIKYWVTRNAVTRNPIAGLVVAPDLGRGPVKAEGVRWETLLEAGVRVATGGGLGLSLIQVGDHLEFDVYAPQTRAVRLSENLDNLRSWEYVLEGPTATRLVLGGPGDGIARKYMQVKLPASETGWKATEKFEDVTDGDTDAKLAARGAELLDQYGPAAGFSVTPVDTESMQYARDYNRGDKVMVEVAQDTFLPDVVAQVVLAHSAGGAAKVTPTVGNSDSSNKSTALARRFKNLVTRITRQERSR